MTRKVTHLPNCNRYAKDQAEFFKQYAISFRKMLELTATPLDATSYTLSVAVHSNLLTEGRANSAPYRHAASLALVLAVAGLVVLWS
jgi:hypothetical protein